MYKILLSSIIILLFSACSSKQYYTPKSVSFSSSIYSSSPIISFNRDGAVLENGTVLTQNGKFKLSFKHGYSFINRSRDGIILANRGGECKILKNGKVQTIKFSKELLAGRVIDNMLIYLLMDNSFGIYDLSQKSIIFNDKGEKTYSIDARITNPIQIDKLVVIPLLNGKITIMNLENRKIVKEIFVSTKTSLNNIIFLKRFKKDNLIVATPHKLISVSTKGRKELEDEISEVAVDNRNIFLFSKDGNIMRLDESLTVQDEKKFRFAHFSVATVYKNRVYALDKQGYLIVSNRNFTKYQVYKFPEVNGYSFVANGEIYYDRNRIELKDLSY